MVDRFLGSVRPQGRCKIGRFLAPRYGFVNGYLGVTKRQILLEPTEHRGYLEAQVPGAHDESTALIDCRHKQPRFLKHGGNG